MIISWIPIGSSMSIKILYEMYKIWRLRTGRLKIMRPLLKKAVEETVTTKMDFDQLRALEQMREDNPNISIANPREVKYKNSLTCWWTKRRRYFFSYGEEFKIHSDDWIDVWLLNSILCPNLLFGGFLFLWALRLDKIIGLNWFIITIPTWFIIIPIAILTILHGITSQNQNVTICEKVVISITVPIGFILSYILILWRLEGYLDIKLTIILIPNFVSVLAFYLYTRQLKTVKVAPKADEQNIPESEPVEINQN